MKTKDLKDSQQNKSAQTNYEADLSRHPNYQDGTPRPTWQQLGNEYLPNTRAVIRESWGRPTESFLNRMYRSILGDQLIP